MRTLPEQVMVAVETFQHCREANDWECIQKLIAEGIDQRTALKLIQFVPLAFCRYMLKDTGVKFSGDYHPPHCRIVHCNYALPHHILKISIRELIATVPTDAQKNDGGLEVTPLERGLILYHDYDS